ncbi:unnamed protein product [Lupinus luteus]|uniref:Uncharacterized protein n=1 Tax=Lupinus luteus TaxID=3873 RepID=A0AAV1Y3G5_LUPLU
MDSQISVVSRDIQSLDLVGEESGLSVDQVVQRVSLSAFYAWVGRPDATHFNSTNFVVVIASHHALIQALVPAVAIYAHTISMTDFHGVHPIVLAAAQYVLVVPHSIPDVGQYDIVVSGFVDVLVVVVASVGAYDSAAGNYSVQSSGVAAVSTACNMVPTVHQSTAAVPDARQNAEERPVGSPNPDPASHVLQVRRDPVPNYRLLPELRYRSRARNGR